MKIKDIEQNLKKEGESLKVPDVYPRAKKAPINRLLSDPIHAFRHKMAIAMLAFVLVIFLVVALGVSAIWLTPSKVSDEEYGYLRVCVGDDEIYGFALDKDGTVLACIKEKSAGLTSCEVLSAAVSKYVEDAINIVYAANATDKVVISVQYDSSSTALSVAQKVRYSIEAQGVTNLTSRTQDNATKNDFVAYVTSRAGDEEVGTSLKDIVFAYVRIAANA